MISSDLRPCVLHIGIVKTGTTSIQHSLRLNASLLYQHGFFLPQTIGNYNMRLFGLLAMSEPNLSHEWNALCHLYPDRLNQLTLPEAKKQIQEHLSQELRLIPSNKTILISSEQLSQRLTTIPDLLKLQQILTQLSLRPSKIILYVREQIGLALSAESMFVLSGKTTGLTRSPLNMWDHRHLIQRWEAVFGRNLLMIRTYDQDSLFNGDVVSDFFFNCLGLSTSLQINHFNQRHNTRLGARGLQLLRLANRIMPLWTGDSVNTVRLRLVKLLSHPCITGTPEDYSKLEREIFSLYYKQSNEWVDANFGTSLNSSFGHT